MYKLKLMLPNGKWKKVSFKSKEDAINELEKYELYIESVICDIDYDIMINDNNEYDYDIAICDK